MGSAGLVALVRHRRQTRGVGLLMTYLIVVFMNYGAAASLYLIPDYQYLDRETVRDGFAQCVIATLSLVAGATWLAPALLTRLRGSYVASPGGSTLPGAYLTLGIIFYLGLSTPLNGIPSLTSILSTGQQLMVVGLLLNVWLEWRRARTSRMMLWMLLALLLPALTMISAGFIGYGSVMAFIVLVFSGNLVRNRAVFAVGCLIVGYLGLSVFVTYFRDRAEIRSAVWGGQAASSRIDQLVKTFGNFELFDPFDPSHQHRIDERLNQSYLVGIAVKRLEDQPDFARGETIRDALIAIVPRAVWPDKPMTAGSGNIVSQYTGIQFERGTSVGVGQVMEFYINFGVYGVVVGFLLIGAIVSVCDIRAANLLASGDLKRFVLWYLPAISLLQVGGSLMEVTTSAAASICVASGVNRYLERNEKRPQLISHPSATGRSRLHSRA